MIIKQKKLSNQHTFTFNLESINFAYNDKNGSGDMDIKYEDIAAKPHIRIEQQIWLKHVGLIWGVYGLVQVTLKLINHQQPNLFWLLSGLACLVWYYVSRITYTVFPTSEGNIFIIQDKKTHDQVRDEIVKRRKTQLLAHYDGINFENGLENEIKKFNWLVEQKALTRDEADLRIREAGNAFLQMETNRHNDFN